jgi:hypothetical protein
MAEREQLDSAGGGSVPTNSGGSLSSPAPPRPQVEPVGGLPQPEPTSETLPAIELNREPPALEPTIKAPLRPPVILSPAARVNFITKDGTQYDDDNLRMFQRAGIIIRDKNGTSGAGGGDPADNIDEARLETTDENGNTISEPILDLSNPNIKQLIAIYPTYQDKVLNRNRLLFTGKKFFDKLKDDFANNNVYAINAAFDERFTIKIVMQDIVDVLERNRLAEQGRDIEMYRNLAFLDSGEIDYDLLISYIDWFVSKPNYLEFVDSNVVPVEYIADYSIKGRPSRDSELEDQPQPDPPYPPPYTPPTPAPTGSNNVQVNTLSSAEGTAILTPTNYTGQWPPFGVSGYPGEFRVTPDGRMFIWIVFNGIGNWRPYEIGTGGGAASTSGGVGDGGATPLGGLGDDTGGTGLGGGTGGVDTGGGPGGGRPGVIP